MNEFGSLAHENSMLLKISPEVKTTQRGKAYVQTENGGKFLISSLVDGKPADKITNPYSEKHIDRLLRNLNRLDRSYIIHSDLSTPNLLLDDNKNVNLIDYQWADTYNFSDRYYGFGLRNASFASFESPNNASMFESAGLAGYTRSLSTNEAENFLNRYYQNKTHYIEKNIRRLEDLNKHTNYSLDNIIDFEKSKAKAYGNMDEYILNAEIHKMNILNLHRRQYSCYDTNKIDPRNILRAIPLCIKTKECADALANYQNGYSSDAKYYEYMRNLGKFWQKNIEDWYTPALKWIYKIITGEEKDPTKIFFPEKINDFSHLNIIESSRSYHIPRKFSDIDYQLRDLFKEAYNKRNRILYSEKAKTFNIIEKVFRR